MVAAEDRLIDWAGRFNSFILPFPSVGHGTVTGSMQPHLAEYLYALSEGDGVDLTLSGPSDPRNGEPFGELGVVRRQDADWQDQTGAPADIALGNIPAGPREVLRQTTFDQNTFEGFFVDSGSWTVADGTLKVAAESIGGDAVSVFHLGNEQLPGYFEVLASVKMDKANGGWNANAYIIFDYQDVDDFKFVGIDDSTNKLVMGHRDQSGWHVDVQGSVPGGIKADKWYNMLVAVNGVNVTLVVDNQEVFQHTFAPRIEDGLAFGLNAGLIGVGSDNARGSFDNIRVQVLPPQLTFDETEEFAGPIGANLSFDESQGGTWNVTGGRYEASVNGLALNMIELGPDDVGNLNFNSYLELRAVVNADDRAGFVFDRYGDGNFKFVVIDAVNDQLIIGHYTDKAGWVNDAVADTFINSGVDYELNVALMGTTVSATLNDAVTGGAQAIVGHAFHSATVDGNFGLLATGTAASFDDVNVKTNDEAFIAPDPGAMLATSITNGDAEVDALTQEQIDAGLIDPILASVVSQWMYVLGDDVTRAVTLGSVQVAVRSLAGAAIASSDGSMITIDDDAAGHGWFVDVSPASSEEYRIRLDGNVLLTNATSDAFAKMDLVTVLSHEVGHVLGLTHDAAKNYPVMVDELDPGTRLLLMQEKKNGHDSRQPSNDQALLKQALQTTYQSTVERNSAKPRQLTLPNFDFDISKSADNGGNRVSAVDWDSQYSGWFDRFSLGKEKAEEKIVDFLLVATEDTDRRPEI